MGNNSNSTAASKSLSKATGHDKDPELDFAQFRSNSSSLFKHILVVFRPSGPITKLVEAFATLCPIGCSQLRSIRAVAGPALDSCGSNCTPCLEGKDEGRMSAA
jgi:hypothetical protein